MGNFKFLLFLSFFVTLRMNAQNVDSLNVKKIVIKWTPAALLISDDILLNCGSLSLGAEYFITNYRSLNVDLGYILFYGNSRDNWLSIPAINITGFNANFETRFY